MHRLATLTETVGTTRTERLNSKPAKTRAKQLDLAIAGRVIESARYAAKAKLLRVALEAKVSGRTLAAAIAGLLRINLFLEPDGV